MRNLKRALSMALATIMLVGIMAVGAGAASYDSFSDKEKIVNKTAVSMLVELGVINGKEDGTYDPEGIITRAEMAKLICVMLNGGNDPQLGETPVVTYTDTLTHWAAPYIEYCSTLGIVAGDGTGKFNPNDTVTGAEAAKMLLVACGYQAGIEGFVGANWAIATNVRANQVGLYKDLSIVTSDGLTRDSAAQMVYNALKAKVVKYDYVLVADGNGGFTTVHQLNISDKEVLEDKFNAIKVEGVVIANGYADMRSNTKAANSEMVKGASLDDNKTYVRVTNGDEQGVFGTGIYTVETGAEHLGKLVTLYVKNDATATNKATVLGSVIEDDGMNIVTDYSGDSIATVADDNNVDIVSGTQIAYNYAQLSTLKSADAAADGVAGQETILIDYNDDGDVDYVLINFFYFAKITRYSTGNDGSITASSDGISLAMEDSDDVVGFADVARDDYVLAQYIGGKLHVEKAETMEGELTKYRGTATLTVDGTVYNVSHVPAYRSPADSMYAAKEFGVKTNLDTESTFYMDKYGRIIAAGDIEANAYKYAFVWASNKNALETRAKVTLSDGTTGTYDVASGSVSNIVDGTIYSYTINKDGELKLTYPQGGAGTIAGNPIAFEKGKSKVDAATYTIVDKDGVAVTSSSFANNNTAFFFVKFKTGTTAIDSVSVYTGYNNAPKLNTGVTAGYVAYNNNGRMGAVAFTGEKLAGAELKNHLYVTTKRDTATDAQTTRVILPGQIEFTAIEVNTNDSVKDYMANTFYTYTIDSDDEYVLSAVPTANEIIVGGSKDSKHIANISSNTMTIGGTEYVLLSSTVTIDISKGTHTKYVYNVGGLPQNNDKVVKMLVNDDDEILMIEVDNGIESTGPDFTGYSNVVNAAGTVTVEYYLGKNEKAPTDAQAIKLIAGEFGVSEDDVSISYVGGAKVTVGTTTYNYAGCVRVYGVSVDDTVVGYYGGLNADVDAVLAAATKTLKGTNSSVKVGTTPAAMMTNTAAGALSAGGDIEIVDGYIAVTAGTVTGTASNLANVTLGLTVAASTYAELNDEVTVTITPATATDATGAVVVTIGGKDVEFTAAELNAATAKTATVKVEDITADLTINATVANKT